MSAGTRRSTTRRLWAGTEAVARGRGGIAAVMRVTGLSRNTIVRGIHDDRVRRGAGGRRSEERDTTKRPVSHERSNDIAFSGERSESAATRGWAAQGRARLCQWNPWDFDVDYGLCS